MTPSAAIARWAPLVPRASEVLDVASGRGRHAILFADLGHRVTAVDRDAAPLRALADPRLEIVEADLENGPWPFRGRTFGALVVVNYLWRPLLPTLIASVAPGGYLLYETFARGHERYGRPRNPDYLLAPNELREVVRGELEVVAFEEGPEGEPPSAVRQRLCATRPRSAGSIRR